MIKGSQQAKQKERTEIPNSLPKTERNLKLKGTSFRFPLLSFSVLRDLYLHTFVRQLIALNSE
jgi:hypothetical protein